MTDVTQFYPLLRTHITLHYTRSDYLIVVTPMGQMFGMHGMQLKICPMVRFSVPEKSTSASATAVCCDGIDIQDLTALVCCSHSSASSCVLASPQHAFLLTTRRHFEHP